MNRDNDKDHCMEREDERNNDKYYCMERKIEPEPFPHTEVRTKRPDNASLWDLSDDLLNWLAWEYAGPDEWPWVFRGVKNYDYALKSKLDRIIDKRSKFGTAHNPSEIDRRAAEDYLLSQFKKAAHHFTEASTVPNNRLEWLALMQHYGAPTRLLDFTRSSYVACYFALEEITFTKECKKEEAEKETEKQKESVIEDCAIWAVDIDWLIENSFRRVRGRLRGYAKDSLLDSDTVAEKFDKLLVQNRKPLVLPVVPPRSNPRLLVQQGLFLCPSLAESSFEENLRSYKDARDMNDHVYKIVIPGRIRTEVLSELRLMNISRANLFPGLEGYASSLAHELEYRSSDEIKRLR